MFGPYMLLNQLHQTRTRRAVALAASIFCGVAASQVTVGVTDSDLLKAQSLPDQWVHYSRDYNGWRYAPMDQINRENVRKLAPKWVFQTGILGGAFETTGIFDGERLYITAPNSNLFCIDPRTGRELWRYSHVLPDDSKLCCGPVSRGVAIRGEKIYFGTLDARLLCFDAKTGLQLWDSQVADYRDGYSLTSPPLVVGNKIIVGPGGAEFGVRGFVDAYDADSGERLWRFWGTAGPGDPGRSSWEGDSWEHGGATAWLPGTYDPELDLLYWGIGNPSPDWNGFVREGDNLYSESIVALDPDTGKLVWYFQNTPHDIFDWSGVNEPILIDEEINGKKVKALLQANRNGYIYAIDRTNGEFLYAKAFSEVNWSFIDEDGRPRIKPEIYANIENHICPGVFGGTNWPNAAYSPLTHMIYIPEMHRCATFMQMETPYRRGLTYYGGLFIFDDLVDPNAKPEGSIKAYDARTGEEKWVFRMSGPNWSGLLTTGGGLVFGGSPEGVLRAFNDETGEVLWSFQTGSGLAAPPTTFMLDGKQVVAIASGWGQAAKSVGLNNQSQGTAYFLFELPGD